MSKRVIPYAKRVGASYYKSRQNPPKPVYDLFCNNLRWIRGQMGSSTHIIDIGPDYARRMVRGASPFYEMERQEVLRMVYPSYTVRLVP